MNLVRESNKKKMSGLGQPKKTVFYDQILGFLDMDFLKESYHNGQLQDAHIMAKLFNLVEEITFLPSLMDIDENNCITLFRELHICWEEWSLLLSFLKEGHLRLYQQYPDKIHKCYDLALKLGGIPKLESYYHNLMSSPAKEELILEIYNPLNPKEDTKQMYNWGVCSVVTSEGKNVTQLVNSSDYLFFHRRLKENKTSS